MRNFFLAVGLWISASAGVAATLNVPSQFPTIQAAVDAAANGDTIMIAAGVYNEHSIDPGPPGKDLIFRGASAASTIIDAQGQGPIFLIKNGQTTATLITRLTMRNGESNDNPAFGGAIGIAQGSAATIRNNIFDNNRALVGGNGSGGAIKVTSGSNAVIEDNTFTNNFAVRQGGAIHIIDSRGTIRRNTFIGNEVDGGRVSAGGGVKVTTATQSVIIVGNTFEGNRASFAGGGVSIFDSDANISSNIFKNNGNCKFGGAVHFETSIDGPDRTLTMNDNLMVNNFAVFRPDPELDDQFDAVRGGGFHGFLGNTNSVLNVRRNVLRGNTAFDSRCPTGVEPDCAQGGGFSTIRGFGQMTFSDNFIESSESDLYAAGIFDKGNAIFENNLVMGNKARFNYSGLACASTDSCMVVGNTFSGNASRSNDAGLRDPGGVYLTGAGAEIHNNFFIDNRGSLASAIYGANVGVADVNVVNNTFAGNASLNNGGAQVRIDGGGWIVNNIFAGGKRGIRLNSSAGNMVEGNNFFDFSDSLALIDGDEKTTATELNNLGIASGNTELMPGFLATYESNYNLADTSPLIDAVPCTNAPATDYEDDARPIGSLCDVGADEFDPDAKRKPRFGQGIANNFGNGSGAGQGITIFSNLILVGAPNDNTAKKGAAGAPGALFCYRREGDNLVLEDKIVTPPGFDASNFGANASFDGKTLVVGAPGDPTKSQLAKGNTALQAAVFNRLNNGTFQFKQPVSGAVFNANSAFGSAMAVQGGTMVVGAPDAGDSGEVNVFQVDDDDNFVLTQTITPDASMGSNSGFGSSVAFKNGVMAAGAPGAMIGNNLTGGVSVFQMVGSNLTQVSTLNGSNNSGGDQFGASISLSGGMMAVGAPGEVGSTGDSEGAVYVFDLEGGNNVVEVDQLKPADPVDGGAFGASVSMSGNTLAVGSPGAVGAGLQQTGAAYVFDPSALGFVQSTKVQNGNAQPGARIGVSIGFDNGNLIVGAPEFDNTGAALLFSDPVNLFKAGFEER